MLATVAADFYWLGRYAERAEQTARLLRHQLTRLPDTPAVELAEGWRAVYRSLGQAAPDAPRGADEAEAFLQADAYTLAGGLMEEAANPGSVLACWGAARENGRRVRPHLPLRMWTSLNQGFLWLQDSDFAKAWAGAPAALASEAIDRLRFFAGVVEAMMPRDHAWRFLELGRFVERLQRQVALLDTWRGGGEPQGAARLAWTDLLRVCGAYEFFCRTHSMTADRDAALAFLVRNPALPRSLRFAVQRIGALLDGIDPGGGQYPLAAPHRATLRIGAALEVATGGGDGQPEWESVLRSLAGQSQALHDLVIATYVDYSAAGGAPS